MTGNLFITLGLMHLLALVSPGPDFALILRTCQRRRLALGAALGISLAILLHASFSLSGISLLLASHPLLFLLLQLAGALYLARIAWQAGMAAWQQQGSALPAQAAEHGGAWRGLGLGLATNLLNPKALLFFTGLLAAMISPAVSLQTRVLLVLELGLLSLLWFGLLAWWLSTPALQQWLLRGQRLLNALSALLFGSVSLSILAGLL